MRQFREPRTSEHSRPRPHSASLAQKVPWEPDPTTLVQLPAAAPLGEMQRCPEAHGDWVTGSQLSWPHEPLARQLIDELQVPQEPPQPSSPHCRPAHDGVQHRPLAAHEPVEQLPQLATVRGAPQLSGPLAGPHERPSREQNWASVSGEQHMPIGAQTGAVEPQLPQLATVRAWPHESVPLEAPQARPERAQKEASDSGWQHVPAWALHTPVVPPVVGHVPHEEMVRKAPQRSIVDSAPHAR